MKSAAMRKREQERRLERKIQKEREAEGDEYEDKEAFVTSSYPFTYIVLITSNVSSAE